jgi:hypothetical protein
MIGLWVFIAIQVVILGSMVYWGVSTEKKLSVMTDSQRQDLADLGWFRRKSMIKEFWKSVSGKVAIVAIIAYVVFSQILIWFHP